MNSWKWAIVLFVILIAFCYGYYLGDKEERLIIQAPSEDSNLELQDRIDSLDNLIPDQPDTIYTDGAEYVVLHPSCYVSTWKKFSPKKTFENYLVSGKFKGKVPPLNFSTCEWGKRYITRTKNDVEDSAEFAGYYAFASWGCGSPCQMCSIIDLRTGNVYSGPSAQGGYEYRSDSRILVVNPPEPSGYYTNCVSCTPEQYLWTGTSFKRLE